MGMSTHVVGFRPADDTWNKMKEAWIACENAGVDIPKEIYNFFEGINPEDRPGAEVNLGKSVREWRDDYRQGYEVDLTKIPKDVKILRFYNSF